MKDRKESILTTADQKHVARMFIQEQRINKIFTNFAKLASEELRKWKDYGVSNVWSRNPQVEKSINKLLKELTETLEKEITESGTLFWNESVNKNDKFVEHYIKNMAISQIVREGMFKRNLEALKSMQNRIDANGFSISKRVWNISEQTKGHIELFLETGLATGRSAAEISRDFNELLKNPNKRFRRIRNDEGKLTYSQPMKDYNPGAGVYRSSRMNAMRLAVTEVNRAYRLSDALRWKQLGFVLGIEINRSRNGEPCDVCDSLKGVYPKEFMFLGFHPFCICNATPIVMDPKGFASYLLNDEVPQDKVIKDIPEKSKQWVRDYRKKYPKAKEPYFVQENKDYFK